MVARTLLASRALFSAKTLVFISCLLLLPITEIAASPAPPRPARNGRIGFAATVGTGSVGGVTGDYNTDIFSVLPGGAGLQQLTSGTEYEGHADWSPDGRAMAFWRGPGSSPGIPGLPPSYVGTPTDIWVMKGSGTENVTNTPEISEFAPDWSPDGTQIVYERDDGDRYLGLAQGSSVFGLFVIDADGSNVRRLTDGMDPSWSPDGGWIAYYEYGSRGVVSLVSADGTRRRTLPLLAPNAQVDTPARYPDWAPNGIRIAFALSGDIWVIKANGTGLKNLTADGPARDDFGPAWSPDGKKIVFIGDRGGSYRLFTMNADGTNIQKLLALELGSSNVTPPSWTER